jgi:hypothetical protein
MALFRGTFNWSTATLSITNGYQAIRITNATAGGGTLTLPAATTANYVGIGWTIYVIDTGAYINGLTVQTSGGELVNGQSSIILSTSFINNVVEISYQGDNRWMLSAGNASSSAVIILDSGAGSSVRCGNNNTAISDFSTVSGGGKNTIASSSDFSTISGGTGNSLSGKFSIIGGGTRNSINTGEFSSIVGGTANTIFGNYSTIVGGYDNTASGGVALVVDCVCWSRKSNT